RDLKPENVLVNSKNEVKITDFSLARRDEDSMLLTRPGQVMGTPHFMSPEQAKGETVDGRTDIYSLGAMLYVLLTGRFPFPKSSVSEVIAAHCEDPRPDPRAIRSEVPDDLANYVMRVMAIERKDRPQTIEALLDELNEIHKFEDEEEQVEVAGALPKGTEIGGYTIQRVLGAGGMGAVYLAEKSGEEVALKILPPAPGRSPQDRIKDVRRFHNEAKLAKRVRSHNTYDVKDFGADAGQAYIALSLEKGLSLAQLIAKKGFLEPDLVRRVAHGMCQALKAIKEAGIVHRDVTPANVMLRGNYAEEPDAGVCLIDFGLSIPAEREKKKAAYTKGGIQLAHIAKKEEEEELDLDEDSLYLDDLPGGTPAYMAPEVLDDPSLVDERADLYGLGATLYHAATGHPPYTGDNIQAVVYQQRNQDPAPIQQFNADFPESLSELIMQLLANSPNMRPRSAKLILDKLKRAEDPNAIQDWRPKETPAPLEPEKIYVPTGFSWLSFGVGALVGMMCVCGMLFLMPQVGLKLPPKLLKLLGAKDPG
ncbi:MAG TPA: hypothetical protein DEA08_05285, partial [Planctomycetes bacterium]|nr:hypothetical protein [Planctomycetota bacterium]